MPVHDPAAGARLMLHWRQNPVAFVRETYKTGPDGRPLVIDEAQQRVLEAVRDFDRVAIRTGRGVGKTANAAGMVIPWFLASYYPALVVTAAGTWNHLSDKLWPEIRTWGRHWMLRDGFEYQDLGIYHKLDPDAWRVVSASSDRAENIEGYHCPNLLILIDEGKAMPDEVFAALIASLTSGAAGVQKIAAYSTPPLAKSGWFARVSTSSDWKLVHVSGLDSPRVSQTYVDQIRNDYGEESPQYQSYVLGNIPEGAAEAVVQARWMEAAQALGPRPDRRPPVLTCDVAREGEDLTTIGVLEHAKWNLVRFASDGKWGWFSGADLMATAGRCKAAVEQHAAAMIVIDDSGLGGGVTDRLRELQYRGQFPKTCTIVACKFGGKPRRDDRFHGLKDELWWATREALRNGQLALPTDDEIRAWQAPRGSDFKAQLTMPIYEYDSLDRIDVLDKRKAGREKTKTLPIKSPDLAHALILGAAYYLRQTPGPEIAQEKTPEEQVWAIVQKVAQRAAKPRELPNPYRRAR